jgi:hypothetical protein
VDQISCFDSSSILLSAELSTLLDCLPDCVCIDHLGKPILKKTPAATCQTSRCHTSSWNVRNMPALMGLWGFGCKTTGNQDYRQPHELIVSGQKKIEKRLTSGASVLKFHFRVLRYAKRNTRCVGAGQGEPVADDGVTGTLGMSSHGPHSPGHECSPGQMSIVILERESACV